jgi:hypothetical protein
MKMKFLPQHEDLINGSDVCFKDFGRNGDRRHKRVKASFSCQDPLKAIPSRQTHPYFKVDPFLAHVQNKSIKAWDVGQNISGDKQTTGFKGKHEDKQRINCKKEGGGLLAETLCESGYTYTFYLWNMQPPRHYIQRGCSAVLHSTPEC